MASNKKYWKSEAELNPNDSIVEALRNNEFTEEIPVDDFLGDKETLSASNTSRRDFLKYVGFSTAAATVAACEGPVNKSIPYVVQPDSIIPGVANYYATTIADGFDFASILVKTREGRPIKIENNTDAKVNGGANARVQASVLTLYDSKRVQGPMANGEPVDWNVLDATVKAKLNALKGSGQQVVLLTQTYASPSTAKLIAEFKAAYGDNVNHVVYDAISEDAALNAYQKAYGERALADYDFEKADLIVSFGADFLGDWQGGGYDSGYAKGRVPKNGKMSRHIQMESNMSLTGANADKRYPMTPTQQKIALAKLYGKLNGSNVGGGTSDVDEAVDKVAAEIKKAGRKAVVVSGLNDENAQTVVLAINKLLASEAFDPEKPKYVRQGDAAKVNKLVADMNAGRVGALIMDGVNPAYTLPNAEEFLAGLEKVDLSVDFAYTNDETAQASTYVAASSHYLESWGDTQFKKGHYSLMQPAIRELFDTKQFQTALLTWMGVEKTYYEYLKETWATDVLQGGSWNKALQDGVFEAPMMMDASAAAEPAANTESEEVQPEIVPIASAIRALVNSTSPGTELVLYSKVGMGDGRQANNPWLQEFPDPISRVSWDNYVTVSKADAESWGLENTIVADGGLNGSYANLTVDGKVLENVPVIVQPGQAVGTIGLSFGYGKKAGMQAEMATGVNAYKLYSNFSDVQAVSVEKASGTHEFACVQSQKTLMGRGDIIKETTLEIFNTKDHAEWNPMPHVSLNHQEIPVTSPDADLWEEFDRSIGHHFNLSIDLNACTGCGACVIACHAENNVPVVGKTEIRRSRDMHWLRIDRYYSSEDTFEGDNEKKEEMDGLWGDKGSLGGFREMEDPSANPQVAFQPVMCQHCNHAPCETVCPVAATSHSRQGQNHMAYNRCVGTRYCANNCPYKVRRFNWFLYNNNDEFDFNMNNDLGKMVLNPDVNVRSRGVMEKCSMCIQMTQKTILDAKRDGRVIKDGEFQTACSAACNSGAMVFGDINDHDSKVAELKEDKRMYHLLEHVGTKPNVFYHVKVRNTNEA
ncbi:MAG: TAT-variant-translocated molybdopterin oxidoreductase [Muricauda sp.]|jgi:molybdopterin-containing oxidoreductase family iron-sulfur binding subunit|nr:TAT-variant-translocated molybdopterin oxidoreductase [Allomuricauda sp.]MBO6533443.1 TAT-variant-translocated molybdopterin oxidoreductase [Allomuricauda sp.]MBO6589898.1 TAT-variant-translocated molybdopterin oxidoreductase [Allomuricauda sp.]MBO6619524.1 TAT-variant-translocated molybdopterin oxidoreductase [Allomuricauda sp.]MBO6645507.1 TAT-variant-translocated molybdopterin oxidoreductase [Allomuricauda sp.]MBO6747714.1 TAT-variant-translocated molybdopterin oxidoreductase [Allomurica